MNGLIGHGEVGSAIEKLYIGEFDKPEFLRVSDPAKGRTDNVEACGIIHVCVPAEFVEPCVMDGGTTVSLYVVHSTVVPGTCRKLSQMGHRVVHAPIEGRHPNLAEALIDWRMPISGEREDVYKALTALRALGIPAESWAGPWEATELAKQMSTLRLGLDVIFMRHVYELCANQNIGGADVYNKWTKTYNALYTGGGDTSFVRPILQPMDGPIGGHCVLSNAENMAKISWLAAQISEMGKSDWKNPCK